VWKNSVDEHMISCDYNEKYRVHEEVGVSRFCTKFMVKLFLRTVYTTACHITTISNIVSKPKEFPVIGSHICTGNGHVLDLQNRDAVTKYH